MSDLDNEDSQSRGRIDLESSIPHSSLVDSTIDLTPLNNPCTGSAGTKLVPALPVQGKLSLKSIII